MPRSLLTLDKRARAAHTLPSPHHMTKSLPERHSCFLADVFEALGAGKHVPHGTCHIVVNDSHQLCIGIEKVLDVDADQIGTSGMAAGACGKSHANQIERLITLWLHVPIVSDHRILRHTLW